MWDIHICEKDPELLAASLERRGVDFNGNLAQLTDALKTRRRLLSEIEAANMTRNKIARGEDAVAADIGRELRGRVAGLKDLLDDVNGVITSIVSSLPNRPHETVPDGANADDNIVVRTWGKPTKLSFPVKDHVVLGEALGIIDLRRGARLAASGFPCLTGLGARLSRALMNFKLDLHRERGHYLEIAPPFLANRGAFFGTGQLPKFEADLYWTADGELGLVPTAEVPLTNMFAGEILREAELPINLTAYTPCWRREAGAYGHDTRGLIRVHQFDKVELVKITTPETSYEELDRMVDDAEEVLRRLDLPHRRVLLCSGDLGFCSAKTFDIEVWLPGQGAYREISSCSNCEDFQARRMNLRFRRAAGHVDFPHTLNGSGLAIGRTLVAIMENYQQEDGSIVIPKALVPYVGVERIMGMN